ncbi:hypothetical protein ACEWPM_002450 [Roseovarius sp. S4756]|uniref:hypothetical protein n=1 Tax=Roseovarius maritimus TaxID=3342637 RepID=UPI00372CC67C
MSYTTLDSTYSYCLNAPLPYGMTGMEVAQATLRSVITAMTGDGAPRIDAMVCIGNRIHAVVTTSTPWATRPWPRTILRCWTSSANRRDSDCTLNGILPDHVSARPLRGASGIRKQIDLCHFTPVSHGLVHHPEDWPMSTIRARPASQMLVA